MNKKTIRSLGIFIGALGAAAYSCSPAVEAPGGLGLVSAGGTGATGGKGGASSGGTAASATTGGSTSGGSTTGGSSSGGTSTGSGGDSVIDPTQNMDDGQAPIEEDAACATGSASAKLKTVNMFVMYDRSWSMWACGDGSNENPPCPNGGATRWDLTSAALKAFFQSPDAKDLRVALRFFPDDKPAAGCDGYTTGFGMGMGMGFGFGGMPGTAGTGSGTAGAAAMPNCDTNACAQPLVDIAPLTADPAPTDVQEDKLVQAIMAGTPPGPDMPNPNPATPTSAALGGAVQWATTYQTAHPNEVTVIVLITDGEPQGCDTNSRNIANIAANGFQAGIATYVIGLGGLNSTVLNQIAAAGGTDTAYTVSSGSSTTNDLLAKLISIKGMALSCSFPVPKQDSSGKEVDPTKINVEYQSGDMGMPSEFGLVMSANDCGTSAGWYYDNPTAPTTINLCPAACDTVTKDPNAQLSVRLGCKPHVITK